MARQQPRISTAGQRARPSRVLRMQCCGVLEIDSPSYSWRQINYHKIKKQNKGGYTFFCAGDGRNKTQGQIVTRPFPTSAKSERREKRKRDTRAAGESYASQGVPPPGGKKKARVMGSRAQKAKINQAGETRNSSLSSHPWEQTKQAYKTKTRAQKNTEHAAFVPFLLFF